VSETASDAIMNLLLTIIQIQISVNWPVHRAGSIHVANADTIDFLEVVINDKLHFFEPFVEY